MTLFTTTHKAGGTEFAASSKDERWGYQRTDWAGWFPDGWRAERLGAIIRRIRSGASVSGADRPPSTGEVGVLRTSSVTSGVFKPEKSKVVNGEEITRLKAPVSYGDILMNRASGSLDMVGICAVVDAPCEGLFLPDKIWCIEPLRDQADPAWLYLMLTSARVRAGIEQFAEGNSTGMRNITQGDFLSIKIPIPPVPEQRKIARILGTWDRALADLDALIEAKREQKKGLAQRLLTGRARLPGFGEGRVPMHPLGNYLKHFSARNSKRRELTPLSCSKVHGIVPQSVIFEKRIASADTRAYKVVRRGDLVYDPMLLWDASIGFLDSVDEGVISPAYATFHLDEAAGDRSFFRHLFDGEYMRYQYKVISQGTNARRRKAMASDFLKIEARIPDLEEQRHIAAVLDAADAEIAALEAQRCAIARQKKGLMQRLLTGQVRVTPDAEDYQNTAET